MLEGRFAALAVVPANGVNVGVPLRTGRSHDRVGAIVPSETFQRSVPDAHPKY